MTEQQKQYYYQLGIAAALIGVAVFGWYRVTKR